MSRAFTSLAEFDAFIAGFDDAPESELVRELSNSHLADPALLDLPTDPFSAEYRDAIVAMHARISGFADYDATEHETWDLDIDAEVVRPAAYRNDGGWLADYLDSFAHVIRHLDVRRGMRVIDLGCGDAEIILHLARLGCRCVALDLHPDAVEVVCRKAAGLGVAVDAVVGEFEDVHALGRFDRVLFYQAFHHALGHQDLVARFDDLLEPGGRIVFGAEPVVEPDGPWSTTVPYPWGPRLDGLSVRQMRRHGWMELGFQTPYFTELLRRHGWTTTAHADDRNGLASCIVAERATAGADDADVAPAAPMPAAASDPSPAPAPSAAPPSGIRARARRLVGRLLRRLGLRHR